MSPASRACSAPRPSRHAKSLGGERCRGHRIGLRVAPEEERLGEREVLDLGRVDALVRGVDQALRLLDAHQEDLGVGERLRQHVAERDRAALALGGHLAPVCLLQRGLQRLEARPVERADEGVAERDPLDLALQPPRHAGAQVRDERVLGVLAGHARWQPQADPRGGRGLHGGRGADDVRGVDPDHRRGGARPEQVGRAAVAHQLHAVEHVGVLAELLGGVLDAAPRAGRVEPVDGRVAALVVQRGEHLDQPHQRVGSGPAEHARVHRAARARAP